jgi:flavin-dependent dehydrogenase
MTKIVIIGGGWAGCAAALAASKFGGRIVLLEKTDLLLGCGLAAGIMRNNGRYTAAEELICLGAGEMIAITDRAARHVGINFPGHNHVSLYDTSRVEPLVRETLEKKGVAVLTRSRVVDVVMADDRRIGGVVIDNGSVIMGDTFIEATGSAGPMGNCTRYGNGCAMCALRCPSFGPRVSLSSKAGVADLVGMRGEGVETFGVFSGSCELNR